MSETGCYVLVATLVFLIVLQMIKEYLNDKLIKDLEKYNDELFFKILLLEFILDIKRDIKDENEKQDSSDL